MGAAQEPQLHIMVQEAAKANSTEYKNVTNRPTSPQPMNIKWWLHIAIYTLFIVLGRSAATVLGQLYYNGGGKSKWMATLAQLAGFPILIPYYYISPTDPVATSINTKQQSALIVALAYVTFGVFLAADCVMYSIGILYLSVSTFSFICASQLFFNAFFSFFLHSQKCTFIINSLFIFTISSTILVFKTDSANPTGASKDNYKIEFICIIGGSTVYGLMLSLTQFSLKKLLKRETYVVILDTILYQSFIATCAALMGLLASSEWKGLKTEMGAFELGKLSYITTLIEMAIASQVFSVGVVGLILEVSSLFYIVIRVLELPVVPILAVILFHNKMDVIKFIAIVLGIWGFVTYVCKYYVDDFKSKSQNRIVLEVSKLPLLEEVS